MRRRESTDAFILGDAWDERKVPVPDRGGSTQPDAVDAHPSGASPFAVMDVVGNVWQWTEKSICR